tara:strand:- start:290 stop:658 length:369 start_codon:yes stop_codon:yes gene_type:complete
MRMENILKKNKYKLYVHNGLYEEKIKQVKELDKELGQARQELEITKQILLLTVNEKKETYNLLTESRIMLTRLEKGFISNLYSSISDMKYKNKLSFDIFFEKVVSYNTKWKEKKWPSLNNIT